MATILVVDDELGIRALLSEILTDEGHTVELAANAHQARAYRAHTRPDLVLLDIWMPDVDGVTLLKEWSTSELLSMPVVMMSGHGTIDTAVEAIKLGALAFLEKPITLQKLLRTVEQALVKPAPRTPPAGQPVSLAMAHQHLHRIATNEALNKSTVGTSPSSLNPTPGPLPEQSFTLDRPLREARDAFEKSYFEFHLFQENGSMTRVAEKTGLERTHLYRKLKQLGVDLSRHKRNSVAA